jgi:hypothetical protein
MDEGYSEGSWRKPHVLKPDASCSSRKSMVAYFDKNSILIKALFHKFPVNPNLGELYDGLTEEWGKEPDYDKTEFSDVEEEVP